MRPARPDLAPAADLSRDEMESLQREIARCATFADDFAFDVDAVGGAADAAADGQSTLDAHGGDADGSGAPDPAATDGDASPDERPLVAGVDQAFLDDRAVSAVVLLRGSEVVERVHAVEPLTIPYVPGLLSFREGGSILAAFERLERDPDLALFDGSGRLHFREAGLATHLGVVLDLPSVGVAKSLLCGRPHEDVDGRPAGWRTPILADGDVEGPDGPLDPETVVGYAFQSRQYDSRPVVNPLYVSPGTRVSAETAVDLVERLGGEYKLPEPTRLADAYADEVKAEYA